MIKSLQKGKACNYCVSESMSDSSNDDNDQDMSEILEYVAICLYDVFPVNPCEERPPEDIVDVLIRNSLTVQSTTRLLEYFEEHLDGRSKLHEFDGGDNVRNLCIFINKLKRTNADYADIQAFKKKEYRGDEAIKDINYVKHRLLAYEVSKKLNGSIN